MDQPQLSSTIEGISPPRLATLPPELLFQIFLHLRPGYGMGYSYANLLALCVTNRHSTGTMALRALYDTVILRSARAMTQLLIILILYPERRRWIQTFSCTESLSGRNWESGTSSQPRRIYPLLAGQAQLFLLARPETHYGHILAAIFSVLKVRELNKIETSVFRQRLYYALLCLMPALQDLKFAADITGGKWDQPHNESLIQEMVSVVVEQRAPHPILANLLHLGIQDSAVESGSTGKLFPCPNLKFLSCYFDEGLWTSYQAVPLLQFPKLQRVSLAFRGNLWLETLLPPSKRGIWRGPLDPTSLFAVVKDLRVLPMTLSLDVLSSLAKGVARTSQVEALEMVGLRPSGALRISRPGGPLLTYDTRRWPNLNNGILQHLAPTLRRLAVYLNRASLTDSLVLFGHRQKLVGLDKLIKLEELVAPSFAIFGALFMEKREVGSWLKGAIQPSLPMSASFNPDDPGSPENAPEYADPTNSGDPKNPDKLVQVARTTELPPALKVLEIYEDVFSDFRWTEISPPPRDSSGNYIRIARSSGKLFRFIKEFAFNFRNRFPKMERVVFWAHDWRGITPQWTNEEIQEVENAFSAQGVHFMHKNCQAVLK